MANVWVEGEDAPLIGDGFTLTTTKEILENADATTFLTQNDLLKHSSLTADGLSIRFQVTALLWCRCIRYVLLLRLDSHVLYEEALRERI